MNTFQTLTATAAATVLALGCAAASARDLSASADVVQSQVNGHRYQNGGVSQEEVTQMRRHMSPYDLRLTFSEGPHNAYAANLKLRITAATGKPVFTLDHAGPLTDVQLPAGHYHVTAEFGGIRRGGSVDVKPGEPANLYVHWPKDAA